MKEFVINDYLSLKLENNESIIYVKGKKFLHCKYLLMNIPLEDITPIEDLQSIDEIADTLDSSLERLLNIEQKPIIPPDVEFWGHCSNLQVWYENEYNTGLLHSNLAFPLLKALTDAGDPQARRVFADEIARRFDTEYLPVMLFLMVNGYLDYLTPQQIESINFFNKMKSPEMLNMPGLDVKDTMFQNFLGYLLEKKPKTVAECLSKAKLLRIFKMENKIRQCFDDAMKIFPDNEELMFGYVRDLNERGKHQEANAQLEKLVEKFPDQPLYWNGLGLAYLNEGSFEKAIKCINKSLEIRPDLPLSKLQLAEAYQGLKNFPKRDMILLELFNMKNIPLAQLRDLALFCSVIGKYSDSVPILKKVLFLVPNDSEAWFGLAMAYKNQRRVLHQRRCLKKVKALSSDPGLISDALNLLGLAYVESWKFLRGIESFYEAVKLDPYNEMAWANQTPTQAMLLDVDRADLAIKISQKIKELRQASEYGDIERVSDLELQLETMRNRYWELPYKCMFCKAEMQKRPRYCPSCGKDLNEVIKKDATKKQVEPKDIEEVMSLGAESLNFDDLGDIYQKFTNQKGDKINVSLPNELVPKQKDLIKMYWPSLDFGHPGTINSLALSSDGKFLVSGCAWGEVKIWDLVKNCHLRTLFGHKKGVEAVLFHKDFIISGSEDATIRLWDINTGKCLDILKSSKRGEHIYVHELVLISDNILLSQLGEGNYEIPEWIEIWNLDTKKLIRTIETGYETFYSIVKIPKKNHIAGVMRYAHSIGIIDISTGQIIQIISDLVDPPGEYEESDYINELAISDDEKYFIIKTDKGIIKKIDINMGKILETQKIPRIWKFRQNNKDLYEKMRNAPYTLWLWDFDSLELGRYVLSQERKNFYKVTKKIEISPDEKQLIFAIKTRIWIWDIDKEECLGAIGGLKLHCFTDLIENNIAITLVNDEFFHWDITNGNVIKRAPAKKDSYGLNTTLTGPYFEAGINSSSYQGAIFWDKNSLEHITTTKKHFFYDFSPDGKIFVGSPNIYDRYSFSFSREEKKEKGYVDVVDLLSSVVLNSVKVHNDFVSCEKFSPDGKHIATSSHDDTTKIWNWETGKILHEFRGRSGELTFSPEGKYLVAIGWGMFSDLRIFNVDTGKEERRIESIGSISVIKYSTSGKFLLLGEGSSPYLGEGYDAKIWNLDENFYYGPFPHLSRLKNIYLNEKEDQLITIDSNGNVYIWDYLKGEKKVIQNNQKSEEKVRVTKKEKKKEQKFENKIEESKKLYKQASSFVDEKNYLEAKKILERAIEIHPENYDAWAQIGYVLLELKEFDEANEWYDKIINEKNCKKLLRANAHYNKACSFSLKGDSANVIKHLKISIGLNGRYKENAKVDPDFESIKDLEKFKNIIKDLNYKEIIELVTLAAEGVDDIKNSAVGFGAYGFVFRDEGFFEGLSQEIFSYRAIVEVGDKHVEARDMKEGKFKMDKLYYYYLINALMIGSLKTLLPSIRFMKPSESDILFVAWVIIRDPKGKVFPAIYHYDRYRMALGDLSQKGNQIISQKYPLICNYDLFCQSEEERYELAEAFENALKKVPLTDYRAIYPGHDYSFHIEVNNGIPLFEEYDYDGDESLLNYARKRKPKWNFEWGI